MQLAFNFESQDNYLNDDFLVSKENCTAFNFINNYDFTNHNLPKIFAIYGETYSGKTHLAHIWQRKSNANFIDLSQMEKINLANYILPHNSYIIENIDKLTADQQIILLHIFNLICEKDAYLLVSSTSELDRINYKFPDLASRIKNIFAIKIEDPDHELTKILLIKNLSQLQLTVPNPALDYLVKKIRGDFAAIHQTTKMLEFYSLEQKKKITMVLIDRILKNVQS